LGSARTALFNFLFARSRGGKFVLRIEDSDRRRSHQRLVEEILEDLRWLGLFWDEGPYFQSERIEIYKRYAKRLLEEGKAYKQQEAIIFKVNPTRIRVKDLIHKEIEFDSSMLKDQVLIKSDGFPTYNFACVVDDYEMGITTVIRGDDHISNTPKQIMLYQAFGWQIPEFAHIPLIMEPEGGRLSKRYGATAVKEYRDKGYLPEALLNYLVLLGWGKGEKEILSLEEMIRRFSLYDINRTQAVFNIDKLTWINAQHIKQLEDERLARLCLPFLQRENLASEEDFDYLKKVVALLKGRIKYLSQITELSAYFFLPAHIEYTEESRARINKIGKDLWRELIEKLEEIDNFSPDEIERVCRQIIASRGLKGADLIHPLRSALTNMSVGPGLFELMSVLGKKKTIDRLKCIIA